MAKYDVILLTESIYIDPEFKDEYIENVLLEDELIIKALKKRGLKAVRWAWDSKDVDWSEGKYLLFRATWDYHHRLEEFSDWLDKTEKKSTFINAISTIRWNLDKHYLFELASKGVNIAKSQVVKKGSEMSLRDAFINFGQDEIVLKPIISAGGRHTYRIKENGIEELEKIYSSLLENEDLIIQEFQQNVPISGEISLMFFGTKYSHSILKLAKKGDFRVQDDFGGSFHDHEASAEEITFAKHAIEQVHPIPVYGRVDVFRDNRGQLALAELELIEPELWFRNNPAAADMLAEEIVLFSSH